MTRIWIASGVFIGVLFIAFIVFVLRISESPAPVTEAVRMDAGVLTDISYEDTYEDGMHHIKGSASSPTLCAELTATSTVTDYGAIRVTLAMPEDEGICLHVRKERSFSAEAAGEENTPVEVYANGALVANP